MKKIFRLIITGCLMITLLIPNVAFASVEDNPQEWQDIVLSDEEFEEILSINPNNEIMPLANGLITEHSISIAKKGNSLIIAGRTNGITSVIRCGFTKITIQRRSSSNASWSDYQTYKDLYADSRYYTISKSLAVPSGYQYRVICTHYAKKSVLSTQKIDNTSNTLSF